jgi:hypothetical protein
MKVYLFVIVCFFILVIGGCGESGGDNTMNTIITTTLTISNESFSELTNVTWRGVSYADNFNPMRISGSIKKTVQAGEGYIFFNRKSNPIVARTRELVVVEEGKDNTFRFHDNTFIVEASNPDNTGIMKDLNSTPTATTTELTANTKAAFSLARKKVNDGSAGTYIITITGSFTLDYNEDFTGTGKTIIIKGDTVSRQIFLDGVAFGVPRGITLELGNNLTLNGNNKGNNAVGVVEGGTFIMSSGSVITDFKFYSVGSSGIFTMNGGKISGNSYYSNYDNSVIYNGGGVHISGGTFTMNDGNITNNKGYTTGGGVYIEGGTFIMKGGIISGNNTFNSDQSTYGGGVYVGSLGSFIKTGGTIDDTNEADVGKVVYAENGNKKRETTAGLTDYMDSSKTGSAGGWE